MWYHRGMDGTIITIELPANLPDPALKIGAVVHAAIYASPRAKVTVVTVSRPTDDDR